MRRLAVPVVCLGLAAAAGCGLPGSQAEQQGKNRLAAVGENAKYKAALTAHESAAEGYRLDLTFETADAAHAPAPLPLPRVEAKARQAGGKEYILEFRKNPLKTDPPGACSRFSAAVPPELSPEERYTITATVEVDGRPEAIRWADVRLRDYTHADE